MIQEWFDALTHAVAGTASIALAASFIWGILSVVLSPCHISSIPLIVGFMNQGKRVALSRAFWMSLLFSTGILITIGMVGLITGLAGRLLGNIGPYGNYILAIIFFLVGLYLLDVISITWSGPNILGNKLQGILGAFLLGLIFGIAVGPCTFAYMAPILAITFQVSQHNLSYGVVLLLMYGIGHCSVIVFAGTFTNLVQSYLNWNETSKGTLWLKKICGILVIVAGLYLLYIA